MQTHLKKLLLLTLATLPALAMHPAQRAPRPGGGTTRPLVARHSVIARLLAESRDQVILAPAKRGERMTSSVRRPLTVSSRPTPVEMQRSPSAPLPSPALGSAASSASGHKSRLPGFRTIPELSLAWGATDPEAASGPEAASEPVPARSILRLLQERPQEASGQGTAPASKVVPFTYTNTSAETRIVSLTLAPGGSPEAVQYQLEQAEPQDGLLGASNRITLMPGVTLTILHMPNRIGPAYLEISDVALLNAEPVVHTFQAPDATEAFGDVEVELELED